MKDIIYEIMNNIYLFAGTIVQNSLVNFGWTTPRNLSSTPGNAPMAQPLLHTHMNQESATQKKTNGYFLENRPYVTTQRKRKDSA